MTLNSQGGLLVQVWKFLKQRLWAEQSEQTPKEPPSYSPQVTPDYVAMVYYIPFIVIFQIGWASTQVSHLSIIPNLTYKENERTKLNSYRYGFTGRVLLKSPSFQPPFEVLRTRPRSRVRRTL